MNRAGIKTLAEWLALPETDKDEKIAYELYRDKRLEEMRAGLVSHPQGNQYTPDIYTQLMIAAID